MDPKYVFTHKKYIVSNFMCYKHNIYIVKYIVFNYVRGMLGMQNYYIEYALHTSETVYKCTQ